MTDDSEERDPDTKTDDEGPRCDEPDCDEPAAVRLHVPWDDDRLVCPAHARALARPDGVVAEPLDDAEAEWP